MSGLAACECEWKPGSMLLKRSNTDVVCAVCNKQVPSYSTDMEDLEMTVLEEADKIINGERQDAYGAPEDNFRTIADFWTVYLRDIGVLANARTLYPIDVAHMMTLLKIARTSGQKPVRDNYVDAIGYLAIAADRLLR